MEDSQMNQSDVDLDFKEDEIESYYNQNSIESFNKNMKNPKKLINLENGKFKVDKDCLDLLKSIEEEIIVIVFSTFSSKIFVCIVRKSLHIILKFKKKLKKKIFFYKISLILIRHFLNNI